MKWRTVEAHVRFRPIQDAVLAQGARVGDTAKRIQGFEKQIEVIQRAREEELIALASREEDLRIAQASRDAFLSEFSAADQRRLIEGRRPPEVTA